MRQKERAAAVALEAESVQGILLVLSGFHILLVLFPEMANRFSTGKTTDGYKHDTNAQTGFKKLYWDWSSQT